MIRGTTSLIGHIGYPTHAFKAPMIYNPCFEQAGIDTVVVPMGCRAEHYAAFLMAVFTLVNIRGGSTWWHRGAVERGAAGGIRRGLMLGRSPGTATALRCSA